MKLSIGIIPCDYNEPINPIIVEKTIRVGDDLEFDPSKQV
jgi:hypothetical protein